MHQDFLVRAGVLRTLLQQLRRAVVKIAVHEVGNDRDRRLDIEHLDRLLLQVIGNRGNPVALIDGKARDRQIRGIGAHQRDVGSVQRGDVGQPPAIAGMIATQHLPRQHRAHRMRDGVMHVQQVKIVNFRNLRHARGQRQIVRRIFEQRIARHFHFVIVNVGLRLGQPDRLRVRDEMHLMAALRQFQAQFGRHYTAAAVRGVTGYPDFHFR